MEYKGKMLEKEGKIPKNTIKKNRRRALRAGEKNDF